MYWHKWFEYCASLKWPLFGWYVWDQGSGLPGDWNGRLAPSHEFLFHFSQKRKYLNKWIETKEESRKPRSHNASLRNTNGTVEPVHSPDLIGQSHKIPDSVIRVNREAARGIHTQNHPAVYPIALPAFIMQTFSQENDIVYEPFCGSGTTIIAAERLKRRCYACEIDEKYASVILARWEQETGLKAELVEEVS
jgi:DNA modification methylase